MDRRRHGTRKPQLRYASLIAAFLAMGALFVTVTQYTMLPRITGWQFVAAMRRRPLLAPIPVALMSGEPDVALQAERLNLAGCIAKPITLDRLLGTVHRLAGAP